MSTRTPTKGAVEPIRTDHRSVALLETVVILPTLVWLTWWILRIDAGTSSWGGPLFFMAVITAVDLIPVPVWGGMQLSLSFPILISVAIVYPPAVAGVIALVGSADPRELRREVSLMRALWNRSQMALAVIAASAVYHVFVPEGTAPWTQGFLVGAATAAVTAYAGNALLSALHASLSSGVPVPAVLAKMHGSRPYEFILSYLGLGLFGAVIAKFYLREGALSVIVFLAPLVFARQMYFRSRALADQLAERNELLAEQAARLEQLLQNEHEAVDELRELNRMKGEFVAVVSHELRTPVTALIGYAKTLRQPAFADDAALREEFLERMERQGDRLLRLVENLLTTAKLETDELQVSVGRLLFEDLAREVVEGLGADAARIRVTVPDDLPVLHTDRQLLGRVLANLLDNALKYSAEDEPCELGAQARGEDHIEFWVRDRGIGIEAAELERIFDPFYQVDSSSTRRFPGTGLGLSMARDLLRNLGGTIAVESAFGEGSTFTVRLPAWIPSAEA